MNLYISITIVVFLYFVYIYIYLANKNFKKHKIKIEETTNNINMLFEKELALFNKVYKILNKNSEETVLKDIPKLKNKTLNLFQFDTSLNSFYKDFKEILDTKRNCIFEEKEMDTFKQLDMCFLDCKALKKYYNENVISYNHLCKSFKYKIISVLKRYKEIELFTIEKEVDFEILKD